MNPIIISKHQLEYMKSKYKLAKSKLVFYSMFHTYELSIFLMLCLRKNSTPSVKSWVAHRWIMQE